jgi:hypothetical protein
MPPMEVVCVDERKMLASTFTRVLVADGKWVGVVISVSVEMFFELVSLGPPDVTEGRT